MGKWIDYMIVIDADVILANILINYDKISLLDLNKLKKLIEIRNNIYVDITTNSIIYALNSKPEMFKSTDQIRTIFRVKIWTKSYINEFFNWRIPSNIRKDVLEVIYNYG